VVNRASNHSTCDLHQTACRRMNNIEQRRFYTFVFYYHLTSLFEVDTGNPRVTRCCEQEQVDFNRRVRERLQDTPRRHPRAFEEALANLGPAGGTTTSAAFIFLQLRHGAGTCVLQRGWCCQLRGVVFLPSILNQVSANLEGNRLHHV